MRDEGLHGWIFLLFAILLELSGTVSMKYSAGFTRVMPSVLMFVFYGASFTLLNFALKYMDVSVFLHQPLKDTAAGSMEAQGWYGVTQDNELKAVLAKHPQAIMFNGHTHWELDAERNMFDGEGHTATVFNSASVGYLWTDADEHKDGSQGYYVEIYADRVVVKGRDLAAGTWLESAQFTVKPAAAR